MRLRLKPSSSKSPISDAARRALAWAGGQPYDEGACKNVEHQKQARDSGTILALTMLTDDVEYVSFTGQPGLIGEKES